MFVLAMSGFRQPGYPFVGRRIEYQPKNGDDVVTLLEILEIYWKFAVYPGYCLTLCDCLSLNVTDNSCI